MTPWSSAENSGTSIERASLVPVANLPRRQDLPSWESFPLADRHLLVGVIVQTARRQVQNQAMVRHWGARE